tara:strand:+ start:1063 stop:1347 length:285 start_codon:yes stop_codon:yes gene_type:complete
MIFHNQHHRRGFGPGTYSQQRETTMPTYDITIMTTFECDITITAYSKDEAITEAQEIASDSRLIYLKNTHSHTELIDVDQDEPSEEESETNQES